MDSMKSVLWFILGLAGGFVAAHIIDKDPRGHDALAEVDARITEFTDRIAELVEIITTDGVEAAANNALGE